MTTNPNRFSAPVSCIIRPGYTAVIYIDGSKRRVENDVTGVPDFPESIDIKVTDFCDARCPHCHEDSTKNGVHADETRLLDFATKCIPPGIELAVGGGNPLAYPGLEDFLRVLHHKKCIANLTVNTVHLNRYSDKLAELDFWGLFHGLGLSYNKAIGGTALLSDAMERMADTLRKNSVLHCIVGIDDVNDVISFAQSLYGGADAHSINGNILLLGAKSYGRGQGPNMDNIDKWRFYLARLVAWCRSVGFDNLAGKQLRLNELLTSDTIETHYMGNDGAHSMYIDAVKWEYAVNSVGTRFPIGNSTLYDMFAHVKKVAATGLNVLQ